VSTFKIHGCSSVDGFVVQCTLLTFDGSRKRD
jgi:hypothetical protein